MSKGTIFADHIMSFLMLQLSKATCEFKYEHVLLMIGIVGKCAINLEKDQGKSHWNVMHFMQDSNIYMLKNTSSVSPIFCILQKLILWGVWILKYPHHVKSSPSHVELYHGKAPKLHWWDQQLMMQIIVWHVKRLSCRLYVKRVFLKLRW
jgi:hypothetical protein